MIDETVEEIEDMQTHSSSEVAVKAIDALRSMIEGEYATVDEYVRSVARNCRALRHANPSHASLFTSTRAVQEALAHVDPDDMEGAKRATIEAIDAEIERITTAKHDAAVNAADLIEPGGTYVTLDFSSTVLEAFEIAGAEVVDDPIVVYTLEARPRYLGRKMARHLATVTGVEVRLVVDSAMGYALGDADRVLIGMTCVVDDVLYNRVGTYPLAATADHAGVPMHVVGAQSKVVGDRFVFENDERSASEVSLEPLAGVLIENPGYDATPIDLLASVVTDTGSLFERATQ